ncbi:GLPGLI family protein [Chryseobacterium fluminis]|uniref:GLPGLI family protein n=1 Tax=Chryseobacterium fluminis TaxID=2983606 RepID=UPI002254575F|nr:GLPGLI family protein [Chryseobacterium sp. MMS21-Ot14]UZT97216.1 GLPGLI family protein [Chryseobacterium sp. MMS21-Ot14]
MKKILFLFFLGTQLLLAQNKRFIYQYTYVPDSTNITSALTELMYLDITDQKSLFYSQNKYAEDSTSIAEAKKGQFYIPNANVFYRVEKIKDKVFFLTSDYGVENLRVEDNRRMMWNILPDKKSIGEYKAQKAVTDFGGRKWIAWFTVDIPLQDGPYKFAGLPGLIIKIEDATQNHSYQLVGVRSIDHQTQYPALNSGTKELVLNQKDFNKLFKRYRNDPASSIKQLYIQGKLPDHTDTSGKFRTGAEIVREVEQLVKERLKKDNNIIEIDLLK